MLTAILGAVVPGYRHVLLSDDKRRATKPGGRHAVCQTLNHAVCCFTVALPSGPRLRTLATRICRLPHRQATLATVWHRYCQFADGMGVGHAAGQGQITGNDCYPIGQVSQQTWEIDTSVQPQVITVTFTGGEDGRQTVLSVTCDASADGDPNFTIKVSPRRAVLLPP